MSKWPPLSDHSMSKTTVKVVVFHCRLAPSQHGECVRSEIDTHHHQHLPQLLDDVPPRQRLGVARTR
jgi:hypothetical protein